MLDLLRVPKHLLSLGLDILNKALSNIVKTISSELVTNSLAVNDFDALKLGYNYHGNIEFTFVTNKKYLYFMVSKEFLIHKLFRLQRITVMHTEQNIDVPIFLRHQQFERFLH